VPVAHLSVKRVVDIYVRRGHIIAMTLHEWLKSEQRTDAWLAAKVGRHRATITKIRNGRLMPSIEVAAKIQRLSRNAVTAADYDLEKDDVSVDT
jgi:DNA-binding XRE family transcriptional regulator